jgi:hypothetical protein
LANTASYAERYDRFSASLTKKDAADFTVTANSTSRPEVHARYRSARHCTRAGAAQSLRVAGETLHEARELGKRVRFRDRQVQQHRAENEKEAA